MKYLLLLCFLWVPFPVQAQEPLVAEVEEKLKRIQYIEDIFFLRISILRERLELREAELKTVQDSYQKTLVLDEIKVIKEDMKKEEGVLLKRIEFIEKGNVEQEAPEVTARLNKVKEFFNYFQKSKK